MTYIEWRDELKNNLMSVSDGERRRVLEYYAEAFADRREAGFSEVQIIEEFGAPYDAAQRILGGLEGDTDGAFTPEGGKGANADGEHIVSAEAESIVGENEPDKEHIDGASVEKPGADKAEADKSEEPSADKAKGKKRKKRWKIAIIVIAAILSACFTGAIVYMFVGLAVNDWQFVTKYSRQEYTCTSEITSLDIEGTVGGIEVKPYDGDKVYVKYPTSKRFSVTVEEKDGRLTVNGPQTTFPFWGMLNIPNTVIMLPNTAVCDLTVSVSAGRVSVGDGIFNDCKFKVSAGSLDLGKITCKTADITVSAGDVDVKGLICSKITARVSAGDISVKDAAADDVDINVSAGSVKLRLAGKKEEYSVFVDKSAGSCNLKPQAGTTAKTIKVDISAGSVEIKFN